MIKAYKLFHKNYEFKNKCISIILFMRIYYPYYKFKIQFNHFKNFYFFNIYILGWNVIQLGLIL